MRHGANIPDIRALQASIATLSANIDRAFPNVETVQYYAPLRNVGRQAIANDAIESATIHNPGEFPFELSIEGVTIAVLQGGEGITLDLNGTGPLFAESHNGRIGLALVTAQERQGGEYSASVGTQQQLFASGLGLSKPPVLLEYIVAAINDDNLRARNIPVDLSLLDATLSFTDNTVFQRDTAYGNNHVVMRDDADLIRVSLLDATETTIASASASISAVVTIPYGGGFYAVELSGGGYEIYDVGGTAVATGISGNIVGDSFFNATGPFVVFEGSGATYTIVNIETGIINNVGLPSDFIGPMLGQTTFLSFDNSDDGGRYAVVDLETASSEIKRLQLADQSGARPYGVADLATFGIDDRQVFTVTGEKVVSTLQIQNPCWDEYDGFLVELEEGRLTDPFTGEEIDGDPFVSAGFQEEFNREHGVVKFLGGSFGDPSVDALTLDITYERTP